MKYFAVNTPAEALDEGARLILGSGIQRDGYVISDEPVAFVHGRAERRVLMIDPFNVNPVDTFFDAIEFITSDYVTQEVMQQAVPFFQENGEEAYLECLDKQTPNNHVSINIDKRGQLAMLVSAQYGFAHEIHHQHIARYSYLQELLAAGIGVDTGKLYLTYGNYMFRGTLHNVNDAISLMRSRHYHCPYYTGSIQPSTLFGIEKKDVEAWQQQAKALLNNKTIMGNFSVFHRRTLSPMITVRRLLTDTNKEEPARRMDALRFLSMNASPNDWICAAINWLQDNQTKGEPNA